MCCRALAAPNAERKFQGTKKASGVFGLSQGWGKPKAARTNPKPGRHVSSGQDLIRSLVARPFYGLRKANGRWVAKKAGLLASRSSYSPRLSVFGSTVAFLGLWSLVTAALTVRDLHPIPYSPTACGRGHSFASNTTIYGVWFKELRNM